MIIEASGDLGNVARSTESLMFAIYLSSINSLGDEDCKSIMGEPKIPLLTRFSSVTEQALINAEFLKTADLMVLQAFTLFLVGLSFLF